MIIGINSKNEVVFTTDADNIEVDNSKLFEVSEVPTRKPNKKLCFNPTARDFYFDDVEVLDAQQRKALQDKLNAKAKARAQQKAATQWLAANDWKVNKRALNEWAEDDPRWLAYLAGRKQAREQFDAAGAILAQK